MEGILKTLKNLDAYPKTMEDFRVRTFSGAAGITLIDETWRLNHMCSFDARLKESLHQAWN
jgi:hypothetical protein